MRSSAVWLTGLIVYFLGNVVYTAALAYAPASLCAALMATVVVANAVIGRVLLKETLMMCDYQGGVLIGIGIALTAAYAPHALVRYDAGLLSQLFLAPPAVT